MRDDRYYVIYNGLWAGSEFLDSEGFAECSDFVLKSLQVEHDPRVSNMYIRDEAGHREVVDPYIPSTVEIDEVLSTLGTPAIMERSFRIHTDLEGAVQLLPNIEDADSFSIIRVVPRVDIERMSQDELINYLDQISREDV